MPGAAVAAEAPQPAEVEERAPRQPERAPLFGSSRVVRSVSLHRDFLGNRLPLSWMML